MLEQIKKLEGHIDNVAYQQLSLIKEIDSINKLIHFMAQVDHESGGFKHLYENLNYSQKGLLGVFPKYFNLSNVASYERNPQKIANRIYGNRMGNGDENSGDGYKFRGRGFLQLTGHDNYSNFSKYIGEDCVSNPDLISTKYPLVSAAYFFTSNHLWDICNKDLSEATITYISKKINGGLIGIDERIKLVKHYEELLK